MINLFPNKACERCEEYDKEVEMLQLRNKRLEGALVELKNRFEALQNPNKEETMEWLSSTEIDNLFKRIKQSQHDKDTKRYLRSITMILKTSYEPSLHEYIEAKLSIKT